jgi:hypothetical protein
VSPRQRRTVVALTAIAVAVLALGTLVYALDRAPGTASLWPRAWTRHGGSPFFGALGGALPSFAHAFAFSLLSALLLPPGRGWQRAACLGWAAIDTLFEIGQHPAVSHHLPGWLPGFIARYFRYGVFDAFDVAAGLLGALAAYGLLRRFAAR